MSVIIRLQNLPWSASALDIRTFFSGLSIPEGGVHIVGGELGDAFIAFSTDEDARLAIQRDNGRLKDTMVKLLLSSRSEMHKVIETARQRVSVMQVPTPAPPVAPAALPSHLVPSATGRPMNVPSPNSAPATVAQTSPAYAPPFSAHSYGASSFVSSSFPAPNLVTPNLGTTNLNALNMGANAAGLSNFNSSNYGSSNFNATNPGSNNVGLSNFGASNPGTSNLITPNLNLPDFNAPHIGIPNHGNSNFGGPNQSTPNFSTPNFGTSNSNFGVTSQGTSNFSGNLAPSNFGAPNRGQPSLNPSSFGSPAIHNLGVTQQVPKEPRPQPAVIEPPVVVSSPPEQPHSKRSAESRSRYGRSRSKSRDREKKSRSRRDRSRSKDRSHRRRDRTRSRDRDRRERRRDRRSRSKDRSRERDSRKSRDVKNDDVTPEQPAETPVLTRDEGSSTRWSNNAFKDSSTNSSTTATIAPTQSPTQLNVQMPGQPPANLPALMSDQSPPEADDQFASLDNNTYSRLQELGSRRNPNAFQDSNDSESRNNFQSEFRDKYDDRRNRNDYRDKREISRNSDRHGVCIKISGLAPQTGYGEVRRFFSGYYIPNNGLKMINDEFGKRTGVVYMKFSRSDNKISALKYDGRSLSGQRVSIEHLDDDEYECAVDNKRPHFKPRSFNVDQDKVMSNEGDKQHDNYDEPNEDDCEPELQNYNILLLDDMPSGSKEYDVVKMFSDYSLLSISMFPSKQYKKMLSSYVHFVNADDAKLALLNRMKHMIGRKVIPVTPCKQEDFEKAKQEHLNANDESKSNMETISIEEINSNEEDDANGDPSARAPVSRDPRQRQMSEAKKPDTGNGSSFLFQPNITMPLPGSNLGMPPSLMQGQRMPWQPDMPGNRPSLLNMPNMPMNNNGFNKTFEDTSSFDCVHISSLPPDTSDRNILDFFSEVGVIPTRIHIMLNSSGEQSGDCFCEFSSVHDARKAVAKNGSILGPHKIEVELCSERRVADALQIPLHGNNMFNGPGRREPFNGPPGGMHGGFGGRGMAGMGPMGRGGFMSRGRGMLPAHAIHPMRPMRGNFRGSQGPVGHGGHRFPNLHFNKFGNKPDTLGDPEIENFGAPGCYVSLENVPFKAGVDEILDFFSNYDLNASDVIRRFNEKGMPTGDARVNFRSPQDAREAVERLNHKTIRDRRISLQLLN